MKKEDEQNEKDIKQFSTKDLYLASTLITLGHEMDGIDFQIEGLKQKPIGYFLFQETDDLINTIRLFWQGKLTIEPRQFMTNLWSLKSQIETVYRSPHTNFDTMKRK